MKFRLFFAIFYFSSSLVYADEMTLCDKNEDVYFSCALTNNDIVSVCAKNNETPESGYVQFRFANKNGIYKKIPEKLEAPKGIISSKFYHEKTYNFISFFTNESELLIQAYSGSYGDDEYLDGFTVGDEQINCKMPADSEYNFNGLEEANYNYSHFPYEKMIQSASKW